MLMAKKFAAHNLSNLTCKWESNTCNILNPQSLFATSPYTFCATTSMSKGGLWGKNCQNILYVRLFQNLDKKATC